MAVNNPCRQHLMLTRAKIKQSEKKTTIEMRKAYTNIDLKYRTWEGNVLPLPFLLP